MEAQLALSRIIFGCRRGMLELDLILLPFAQQQYSALSEAQQEQFASLISLEDQDLFRYLVTGIKCEDPQHAAIIDTILTYAKQQIHNPPF